MTPNASYSPALSQWQKSRVLAAKQTRHLAVIFGRGFWEHFCDEEGVYASLKG